MKRMVCNKQKFSFPEEDGCPDALYSLLVNLANKRRLFSMQRNTDRNKYHTGMQILFGYAYEYLH